MLLHQRLHRRHGQFRSAQIEQGLHPEFPGAGPNVVELAPDGIEPWCVRQTVVRRAAPAGQGAFGQDQGALGRPLQQSSMCIGRFPDEGAGVHILITGDQPVAGTFGHQYPPAIPPGAVGLQYLPQPEDQRVQRCRGSLR